MKRLLIFTLTILLLITAGSPLTLAASIYVEGGCSLRDAIQSANRDRSYGSCRRGSGADTIYLSGDVKLRGDLPDIKSDITIDGEGYGIDGDNDHAHFTVRSRGQLILRDVALVNGYRANGGSIYNQGFLRIVRDVLFIGNKAGWDGGAIYNSGDMNISEALFVANEADWGGAIMNKGDAWIRESGFHFNEVEKGGGAIFNDDKRGTSLLIQDSEFIANATDDLNHIVRHGVKDASLHALYHAGAHLAWHAATAGAVKSVALGAIGGPKGIAIVAASAAAAGLATGAWEAYQITYGSSGKGGAILNQGPATIEYTRFHANAAYRAGAILNSSRDLRLHRITQSDNDPNFCVGC